MNLIVNKLVKDLVNIINLILYKLVNIFANVINLILKKLVHIPANIINHVPINTPANIINYHSEEAREYPRKYYQLNRKRVFERVSQYEEYDYRSDMREGPTFVCMSCARLLCKKIMILRVLVIFVRIVRHTISRRTKFLRYH